MHLLFWFPEQIVLIPLICIYTTFWRLHWKFKNSIGLFVYKNSIFTYLVNCYRKVIFFRVKKYSQVILRIFFLQYSHCILYVIQCGFHSSYQQFFFLLSLYIKFWSPFFLSLFPFLFWSQLLIWIVWASSYAACFWSSSGLSSCCTCLFTHICFLFPTMLVNPRKLSHYYLSPIYFWICNILTSQIKA